MGLEIKFAFSKSSCTFEVPNNQLCVNLQALTLSQHPRTNPALSGLPSVDLLRWLVGPYGGFVFLKISTQNKMAQPIKTTSSSPGIGEVTRKFTQQRDLVKTAGRIISMKRSYVSSSNFQFLSEQEQTDFIADIEQTTQFLINLFSQNPIIPERRTLS